MENKKTILWFRRDLRVEDSMLLSIKAKEVLPIFIFDKTILDELNCDDKRVDYIFKKVLELKKELKKYDLDLAIFYAEVIDVFTFLKQKGFSCVYASVDYDNYARNRDNEIGKLVEFNALFDCYIYEPKEILKKDGSCYVVFAPFFKEAKQQYTKEHALKYEIEKNILSDFDYFDYINEFKENSFIQKSLDIKSIGFVSNSIKYEPAIKKLKSLKTKIQTYEEKRDYLNEDATSNLSLDLRFGAISIRRVLRELISLKKQGFQTEAFFRQLVFRDFYASLLYHFPKLHTQDFRSYAPYMYNKEYYERFITANTGVPIVDAGVTQLLTTGYMHNRVRMIVASFFCKHLMLPWQKGEAFFAKYLMDYDAASNILSWQWSSSTGIDAQPYFRVFNPYLQAKKFDKDALYIKKYLKPLKGLEAKKIHDEEFLFSNSIKGYTKPIVKHKQAREYFLEEAKSFINN
ncbi:cryptochrome/photolyase family protein [Malaciobacter halophilus]|nr:deoxyribodipyrimidine photo-lyase [Malaciobacter halophilus]